MGIDMEENMGETFYTKCKYDRGGNITVMKIYGEDNAIIRSFCYEYDEIGYLVRKLEYDSENLLVLTTQYTYYKNGFIREKIVVG